MMPPDVRPARHGPRDNVLGVSALAPIVITHTDDVAVSVTDITAFPDGFGFDLDIRLRETGDANHQPSDRNATDLQERMYLYYDSLVAMARDHPWRHWPDWFTVEYPGGTVARSDPPFWTDKPEFPVLVSRRPNVGGGGGNDWKFALWACPLPEPGVIAFVCDGFPELNVPTGRAEVETAPLLDAARRAIVLWDDDRPTP
jgi:hypothetical protein